MTASETTPAKTPHLIYCYNVDYESDGFLFREFWIPISSTRRDEAVTAALNTAMKLDGLHKTYPQLHEAKFKYAAAAPAWVVVTKEPAY